MKTILFLSLFPILMSATACGQVDPFEALAQRNAKTLYPAATMDSLLAAERGSSTAERVGLWARRFEEASESRYLFGLADGGYVSEGLIVSDFLHDCVSLTYRASELARSSSTTAALRMALGTRFAGAELDSIIDAEGRANYDRIEHLDFSLDMIRTGHWGRNITRELSGAALDGVGSSRYAADSFYFVPQARLLESDLREGDIAWLVLNPMHEGARKLRKEYGLVIGHIGIVIVEEGRPWLVHAASSALEGHYEGGRVVKVPLSDYLSRVDRFYGVMITRFD
ncbi:DUF1460 domain-containing protein [bacterium]|nr:DUF1460 domain-containing protein [bacterium]